MRPLLVVHHLEPPAMGRAAAILDAAGLTFDERLVSAGEPLPALDAVAGIVSLGGRESVTELDRYPYLLDEQRVLREAVAAGVPVLGVCLGGQLLAHALGGSVRRAPAREIRWFPSLRLPAAEGDPLFGALPETVSFVRWNEDAFELPADGVELLQRTGAGADAFRAGRSAAWGVQFHPELDGDMLDGWYAGYPDTLLQAGVSEADARAADAAHAADQEALAAALFGGFARVVVAREAAATTGRPHSPAS